MRYYYVVLGSSYVTLFKNDELNSFPISEMFYDLCIKKINATQFLLYEAEQFIEKWRDLKYYNINFKIIPK